MTVTAAGPTVAPAPAARTGSPAHQAYLLLRLGFTVAPILFGLDKFAHVLVDWDRYLAPEFVDLLNYRLGVHHAEIGDFGSAGGAEIHLARSLESPLATLTVGENGYTRAVAGSSLRLGGCDFLLGG